MSNKEISVPQKNISIIVATDEENGIGKNNQLLWHLPKDLKFFKNTTSGHTVIMGRKTFDSVGKPLPNRRNIVITRNENLKIDAVETFTNIETALANCNTEQEIFIIGGGEIYRQSLSLVNKLYLTKVHHQFEADTFFPKLEAKEWHLSFKEDHEPDEKHNYAFSFLIFNKLT